MIKKQSISETLKLMAFKSPSANIWRSRISWRIALAVFLTILTVQVTILSLTIEDQERQLLDRLRELGRTSIATAIDPSVTNPYLSPIEPIKARRIIATSVVRGLSVYFYDEKGFISVMNEGEPVNMIMIDQESLSRKYRSSDGTSYEIVYRPNEIASTSYIVVAKLDSSKIDDELFKHVEQTILIMLLLSAFVTTVLMIALGYWLLEPILFMRDNLMSASQNPEDPNIPDSPFDPGDEIGGAISVAQNLIRQNADNIQQIRSAAEDKIHKLAYYDSLTGLPNRTLFIQSLTEMSRKAGDNEDNAFAVIAMDLDHFKDVNDSMGHNIGDAILRGVGKRLRAALPESAVVARSGEDEFAITIPITEETGSSKDVAETVASVIRNEPFKVFNEEFQIRVSIGVAKFPQDGADPDQVLKNADIALNRAKEEGRDMIKEYSEDYNREVQERFQMLRDLRDALDHNQLVLHFQPQFDLKKGNIIGAEALLRWWKPDNSKDGGSFISPGVFIPIAEQSGLIVPIGEWVLRDACEKAANWQNQGHNVRIAVNVSGVQFYQSDLVAFVEKTLNETGLNPSSLELEVTESVFMDDITHTVETLKKLHALGVELAIDDFGTGYSSLSYLRQFPIDRLKIDQSFIRNALNDQDDAAIARTIVRLGHSLNLKVIAEGVETKEHENFLREQECDEVQGFRYSKPIPVENLMAFMQDYDGNLESFDKQ